MRAPSFSILALILVSACGDTDRPLRDLQSAGRGPDEFAVVPLQPLEIPQTQDLPTPTPGGANRTDPVPNDDAIRALGGSPEAQFAGGVPASDSALIAQTASSGVDPAIRSTLAAEDAATLERARRSNIFNPLGRDRYFPAYARQSLDVSAELTRLEIAGVPVPDVPEDAQLETLRPSESLLRQLGIRDDCVFVIVGGAENRVLQRVCEDDEESVEAEAQ